MKKRYKFIFQLILFIIIFICIYQFEYDAIYYVLEIKNSNPAKFNGLEIAYPKYFYVKKFQNQIFLENLKKLNSFISISINLLDLNIEKVNNYIDIIKEKEVHLIDYKLKKHGNIDYLFIEYVDYNWVYTRELFVFQDNILIIYKGKKKDFVSFKEIKIIKQGRYVPYYELLE